MQGSPPPIRILGAACGHGSPDVRCAEGPEALRAAGLLDRVARLRQGAAWDETLACANGSPLPVIAELCVRLAAKTAAAVENGSLPLVLTGDHSCAVGAWAGVSRALAPRGPLGLVWVDAHLDSHTPATSHTGAINGMPLAALLGSGDQSLTQCGGSGAKILPDNLCIVGARSYEEEELRFLSNLGVRVFFAGEISRRGIHAVMRDAIDLACAGTAGFGISIDLDVIDPREAPGVGTPAAEGIAAAGLCESLRFLGSNPALVAIEVSEYNPSRDRDESTARIVLDLIDAMLESKDTA